VRRTGAWEDEAVGFTFTEEQQEAVEATKAVFSGIASDGVPSPALAPGEMAEEFDRPLWAKLADTDLLSLPVAGLAVTAHRNAGHRDEHRDGHGHRDG
jgi:hypothetical protein